jgi:signal transduction histidine kinase
LVVATVSSLTATAMMPAVVTLRRSPIAPTVGQAAVWLLVGTYAIAFAVQPLIPRVFSGADVVDSVGAVSGITALVALTVAGALSLAVSQPLRVAGAAWIVAAIWLVIFFAESPAGTADARWAAVGLVPLLAVGMLELGLAALVGPLHGRARVALGALWTIAIAVALARFATYAPFYEVACLADCERRTAIVNVAVDARRAIGFAVTATGVIASLAALAVCVRAASSRSRTALLRLAAAGGGLLAVGLICLSAGPRAYKGQEPLVFAAIGVGATLFGLGIAAEAVRVLLVRQRLRRLVENLEAPAPSGAMASALGRALGDPGLRVGYYVPGGTQLVAATGAPFARGTAVKGHAASTIDRSGEPIALIEHRPGVEVATLDKSGGAALIVALDNERLDAAALAQLAQLQAAREMIVKNADTERKRIERDLHDGAQHGLLAAAVGLRTALSAADAAGLPGLPEMRQAEADLSDLTAALRKFVRRVFPPLLAAVGLGAALRSLSDESPLPLSVVMETDDRAPAEVELSAYRIVVDEMADAVARGATELVVAVGRDRTRLLMTMRDDGSIAGSPPVRIADRAGAAGGRAWVESSAANDGHILRVELPCG